MRNLLLLLIALTLASVTLNAQTEPDWTRILQATTYNYPAGRVIAANADNLFMAGSISGPVTFNSITYTGVGLTDMIIFKFSNTGNVTWAKQFNTQSDGTIYPSAMKLDANQNLFIVGTFTGSATFGNSTIISDVTNNCYITKLDAEGNALWATAFSASGTGSSKMAFDTDGNIYLLNKTAALVKFNSSGNILWQQNFPNRTLQAIAVSGTNLFLGGTLQVGTTAFGSINLIKSGTAYNKGFIVKANLDGVYSDSLAVTGSPLNDGSSVNDIIADINGSIIITGGYSNNLGLRNTTFFSNSTTRYYTYLAKCDENFVFSWAKSSNAILIARDNFMNRLFLDNTANIYQYGLSTSGSTTFTYGSVSLSQQVQYLFKFNANGEVMNGYGMQNTAIERVVVAPTGKIVSTGTAANDGISQQGNFFVAQNNNDMSSDWLKKSSKHQGGSISINYVKHDAVGNTYTQARVQGYCNFFGTIIKNEIGTTVNAKFDKSGNALWINQINDVNRNIYGSQFTVDKDNNLLTIGRFITEITVGIQNFINTNAFDDSYVVKYAPNGQILWATQLATDGQSGIQSITSDKAGNVIISGQFQNMLKIGDKTISAGTVDGAFIIKLDAAGNCLWANGYPIGDMVYSTMPSTDENNNIYMAGEMYNSSTNQLVFGTVVAPQTGDDGGTVLVKFDPDGIPQWAYTYGGVNGQGYSDGWPVDIKTDGSGNTYLWGYCPNNARFGTTTLTNPVGSSNSYYLTKIDASGGVVWAEAVYQKSPIYKYGDLLDLDKNGNIYAGGHFKDAIAIKGTTYTPLGTGDFFAAKFANDGTFQWIKSLPANSPVINAISVYDDDVLSICGFAGKDPTLGNFTIVRQGTSACIIATLGMLEPLPNSLFVDFTEGSETTFSFTSNTDWTVTSDQEWLTISSNSGTGDGLLTFTASENTTGEARTATVTITFLNTKAPSITLTIIQDASTTGINDMKKNQNLVYPNPATNSLNLNPEVQDALISIYDSKGKMVANKQVKASEINISNLRNGIYTIKTISKSGVKTQKFVKH